MKKYTLTKEGVKIEETVKQTNVVSPDDLKTRKEVLERQISEAQEELNAIKKVLK